MSVVFHCSISLVDTADTLLLPHSDNLWLTREDHDSLVSHLKSSVDMDRASYVLDTIQLVLSLAEPLAHQYLIDKKQKETKQVEGPVVFLRDWIWFPMIYTREKTVSWADIPAAHRKMTSRWKESYTCSSPLELNTKRVFHTMTELKFDIHGAFSNHNNLNMLQQWLEEKGCEEAFHHLF
ncbi:hypothetical protein BDB01DRAFT_728440 [Pilobolus umbonatus]|nr:hypothetical protein BDB01DRAFT_728440 [Pilobolus umbonatus]